MFNYPQHGTADHIQGQGDRLHITSKGVQKIFFYKFRQFCPFRWQGFLGWLMNYEEDTAWLVYSCQVIHTCLIVTQTTTIFFFSTGMHSISCVKWGTLAIFCIMLLWILVYCQLRGSPWETKNKPFWNTDSHFEIVHLKADYSFLAWQPLQKHLLPYSMNINVLFFQFSKTTSAFYWYKYE